MRVLIATSNRGKLRDFAGAASLSDVEVLPLPNFQSLPPVDENCPTLEGNARKKAEFYSRYAPDEIVLADDSGLEVDALGGAPGVRSARYAADASVAPPAHSPIEVDDANNQLLLQKLAKRKTKDRAARFVCVLAASRNGKFLATFEGEVRGEILPAPRGRGGFGYDPLFFIPLLGKTLAELSAQEKAKVSHRGAAFRKFLEWLTEVSSQKSGVRRQQFDC